MLCCLKGSKCLQQLQHLQEKLKTIDWRPSTYIWPRCLITKICVCVRVCVCVLPLSAEPLSNLSDYGTEQTVSMSLGRQRPDWPT